jgi:hypothetical protein
MSAEGAAEAMIDDIAKDISAGPSGLKMIAMVVTTPLRAWLLHAGPSGLVRLRNLLDDESGTPQ